MPSLRELGPDQCESLLRSERFGRVSLLTPHGLEVVPVNYVVHGDAILVRITPDGALARYGHGNHLAFEVDLVDPERWSGWSVVARGLGQVSDVDPDDVRPVGARPTPWASGDRGKELRIEWTRLTGRVLGRQVDGVLTRSSR